MNNNNIPTALNPLFTLAEDAADGLHIYEVAIGIKQNIEANLRADLASARTATADYDTHRSTKAGLNLNQSRADVAGQAYLSAVRKVLTLKLGEFWSAVWHPTGFPNQSTAVPSTTEARQARLFALKDYFTANPTYEVAALTVTAAQAGLLATALSTARSAVNESLNLCGQKKIKRDAAVAKLRARLRGLVFELGQLLTEDDPRWNAFGLNLPSATNAPAVPAAPRLTGGPDNTVLAAWPAAPRASYYRVFQQVVGVDTDWTFVDRPADNDCTLADLPAGATVKVCVSAVNAIGETQRGPAAQITLPPTGNVT